MAAAPTRTSYDVVIVGGAMMGASTAWFLTELGFDGRILVIERDPTYAYSSTSRSNSCIRQQFSSELNIRISQFGADFIQNLRANMGGDPRVPDIRIQNFGYLYLAADPAFADALRAAHAVQVAAGAGTRLMSAEDILAAYPFYNVEDVILGSHNTVNEGYWDGITVFDWWRRQARERGVEFAEGEVTGFARGASGRIESVMTAAEDKIACGVVVNATGPRAGKTCAMLGIPLPVEPRKRYTWVFTAERPLDRPLPLTIDPSGVHVRQDTASTYMAGGHADYDPAVEFDDFEMDHALWMDKIWPAVATRIPQFEAIRVTNEWAGHYAYNTLDQNAVIGPHPEIGNFMFINGFSGHGLQQSPAMGRGMAELIIHGGYRSLDLSPFGYERITEGRPFLERAII